MMSSKSINNLKIGDIVYHVYPSKVVRSEVYCIEYATSTCNNFPEEKYIGFTQIGMLTVNDCLGNLWASKEEAYESAYQLEVNKRLSKLEQCEHNLKTAKERLKCPVEIKYEVCN